MATGGDSTPPDEQLFNGPIKYEPWLTDTPVSLLLPTITMVTPDRGSVTGGTLIQITGSRFVAGATVTVNGGPATGVSVDSETQITAITPPGTIGPAVVAVTTLDGRTASKEAAFTYVDTGVTPSSGIYQGSLALTKGVNIFSMPLIPDIAITASKIATDLGATVVLRAFEGRFQAYIPDTNFGPDFPLEVGKGIIVNLLEPKTYSVTGRPWGTEVPAAPATPFTNTWAFVVAGRIDGLVPVGAYGVRTTNLRTGESLIVPIAQSGEFTAAFVDLSKRSVVAAGDVITAQLIDTNGFPLTQAKRHLISPSQITHAYLLIHFPATPSQTQLLQNYPNPFNPETWIPFQLAQPASVTAEIYNLNGRLIRRLDLGHREAGWHLSRDQAAYWDGRNRAGEKVSSGIYFYKISAGDYAGTRRMVILK